MSPDNRSARREVIVLISLRVFCVVSVLFLLPATTALAGLTPTGEDGGGGGIDPNGWKAAANLASVGLETLPEGEDGGGGGIDPNGWVLADGTLGGDDGGGGGIDPNGRAQDLGSSSLGGDLEAEGSVGIDPNG